MTYDLRMTLRIHKDVLPAVATHPVIGELLNWAVVSAQADIPDVDALCGILGRLGHLKEEPTTLPPWLCDAAVALGSMGARIRRHLWQYSGDGNGWIISVPRGTVAVDEDTLTEDGTSEAAEQTLASHLANAAGASDRFAAVLAPALGPTLRAAALWHDLGKIDQRFQTWLRGGDEVVAMAGETLAKSALPLQASPGFRHEMIGVQVLDSVRPEAVADQSIDRDLLLHLIASHHGHARPFAPFREESDLPDLTATVNGCAINIPAASRAQWPAAHSLGSGIPDRFWRLTRRFGWWGLAYLEAHLRLSDWCASERHASEHEEGKHGG